MPILPPCCRLNYNAHFATLPKLLLPFSLWVIFVGLFNSPDADSVVNSSGGYFYFMPRLIRKFFQIYDYTVTYCHYRLIDQRDKKTIPFFYFTPRFFNRGS